MASPFVIFLFDFADSVRLPCNVFGPRHGQCGHNRSVGIPEMDYVDLLGPKNVFGGRPLPSPSALPHASPPAPGALAQGAVKGSVE